MSPTSYQTAPPRIELARTRTVVWLAGNLDVTTVRTVTGALATAMGRDDVDVVVDLSDVTFLDASTVRLLHRGRTFLEARSRTLRLRAPARCACRVLTVCGLGGIIEATTPDAEQARFVTEGGAPTAGPTRAHRPLVAAMAAR